MENHEVARLLRETARLLELRGENPFRIRAYEQAAEAIEQLEDSVAERVRRGTLTEIPGIGRGLAAQIQELVERGSSEVLERLRQELPPGLLELLTLKGLGPQRVRQLWQLLGITSLDELEAALREGRLNQLKGFGPRLRERLLRELTLRRHYRTLRLLAQVSPIADELLTRLRQHPGVQRAEQAGAIRRLHEVVDCIELVVAGPLEAVQQVFALPHQRTGPHGETLLEGTLPDGFPIRLILTTPDAFGTTLWWYTGSAAHCQAFVQAYGPPTPCSEETAVYEQAGLPFIPPELRENQGELEAAAHNALPSLITQRDLQGVLHNHSTYSDGRHTLREMAEAAYHRGYHYFGIGDHSQSLTIARGLSITEVHRQQQEIRALNEALAARNFRILSGTECDILPDGTLDYPDEVLAGFDYVVASVHTRLDMDEKTATERILRALRNPHVTILGHPTGRLLLRREGYPLDWSRIIDACATYQVAIELNANPQRLDIDWRRIRMATAAGVPIVINPDAHAIEELDYVRWGVAMARKGWLTPDACLNTRELDELIAWFQQRRPRT
ncbi:DNA polymerase/3'-5' exonuclease PolX [Rhodothermus profundi]|uniref:DNA polymerase (Family 10) n=1 Tax=Rhodothermus profundi TaxID=633813 RepID=A0A1M6PLM2_9BACT|nr:DNA polymerase/3'-5' exonuclease PolX [Rhodothermus profundi]SHK08896.1 DNA polymerase (family 10) [Rhodothermus profundi]